MSIKIFKIQSLSKLQTSASQNEENASALQIGIDSMATTLFSNSQQHLWHDTEKFII
jgi:hypothetical protein